MESPALLAPPIAFVVILAAVLGFSFLLSRLALTRKVRPAGLTKPYACGEDVRTDLVRPDYGQFFPFAFFFVLLHVLGLIVTTVPVETAASFYLVLGYVVCAIVGLLVLYRR